MFARRRGAPLAGLPSIKLPTSENDEDLSSNKFKKYRQIFVILVGILSTLLLSGLILNRIYFSIFQSSFTEDDRETIHRLRILVRRLAANVGSESGPVKLVYMADKPSPLANTQVMPDQDLPSTLDARKSKKMNNLKSDDPPTPLQTMVSIPEGSAWCSGSSKNDRTCRFKNLCYNPNHEEWFIIKTNRSIQEGVPIVNRYSSPLLYLSSIDNHPYFAWNYVEASPFIPELQNIPVRYEAIPHFLFKRLHPDNIMHNLHDDVLNLYFQIKKYLSKPLDGLDDDLPFSLDTQRLLILDQYESTSATKPFQYLSNYPIRFGSYLTQKGTSKVITCFNDAFLGNSHITRWYQYGFFDNPQGPISPRPNGMHVREVAEWFIKRIGSSLGDDEKHPPVSLTIDPAKPILPDNSHFDFPETDLILIMARKWNRLILNENELANHLTEKFGYKTEFLHNENQSFEEQIKLLRRARIVLAMHGSILVMGMFCRRGTVIIEMFPYAVPPENYTPYRTMSQLSGMDLVYRSWANKYPENSIGHPEDHEFRGGLQHLSPEMRELVLNTTTVPRHKCCTSPFWLYRIYQDTKVHLEEVTELIKEALIESRTKILPNLYQPKVYPLLFNPVKNIRCAKNETLAEPGTLIAYWPEPWTGCYNQVRYWELLVNNNGLTYKTKNSECSIRVPGFEPGKDVVIFVRPVGKDGTIGEWGEAGKCKV